MAQRQCDTLLLGAESVGKSLLVKQLKAKAKPAGPDAAPVFDTTPTMGVELDEISVNKTTIVIREVGGTFVPVWPKYFKECSSVIFVIDVAHPTQISTACMEFYNLLVAEDLQGKPFLLLLNKIDFPGRLQRAQVLELLRFTDLVAREAPGRITVEECSAFTGAGLDAVSTWLLARKKEGGKR